MADGARSGSNSERRRILPLQVGVWALFWCLFSGKFDLVHLSYGVLSIVLVMILSRRMVLAADVAAENRMLAGLRWNRVLAFSVSF